MSAQQFVAGLRRAASQRLSGKSAKRYQSRQNFLSLALEQLESRQLLATFAVNSFSDAPDVSPGDGSAKDGSGAATLRAAIMEANAWPGPDEIRLPAGTYTLTIPGRLEDLARTGDLDVTDDLTIVGAGADATTIDADHLDRVFHLPAAAAARLDISGITITGGRATDDGFTAGVGQGGGLLSFLGEIRISDSRIVGNQAIGNSGRGGQGGGVYTVVSTTTLSNSTIENNRAEGSPGAAGSRGQDGQGGGVFSDASTWSLVSGSTIANNQAVGGNGSPGEDVIEATAGRGLGGGIYSQFSTWDDSTVANPQKPGLVASTISGNQAIGGNGGSGTHGGMGGAGGDALGGALFAQTDTWTLLNSTLSTNSAVAGTGGNGANAGSGGSAKGGGLYAINGTSASISYVTIALNQATGGSGGAGAISGDTGTGLAGGVFHDGSGSLTLSSTIVATNQASTSSPDVSGVFSSGGHNLIGDSNGSTGFSVPPDQLGTSTNPIDPVLGPLQNNGGPTFTHALLVGSPAIDAADSSHFPLTDQRGVPRPIDGDGNLLAVPDIGAYEAPGPARIHIDKFVKQAPPKPPSSQDLCDTIGRPKEVTFRYTGGGPDATNTHQPIGKYSVAGDPLDAPLVFIRVNGSSNATSTSLVFFSGNVALNAPFTAKAVLAGQTRFPANTFIHIFDTSKGLLQTVGYHTSCSAPIVLGDVTGGVTLTGVVGETGSASLPPPGPPGDFGSDADVAPGPTIGYDEEVVWTYVVTNPGTVPITNVVVTDDNETPGNPFDDFHPEPLTILQGTAWFNIGDTNQNNLLDPGEAWLYSAKAAVLNFGQHANVATATGVSQVNQVVVDSDPAHFFVPSPCAELTLNGNTPTSGAAGNIRTFSIEDLAVRASGFSRDKNSGAWAPAYLGSYAGGLGVTDTSEGKGTYNSHTVDNLGRDNYVLFEFSQSVVMDKAFLGYVISDSDLRVWIGTFPDPFNNHLTLSDSVLIHFGFTEMNETSLAGARWADLNAGSVAGNAVVIAARTNDSKPNDQFKISRLTVCGVGNPPKAAINVEKATNGQDADTPSGPLLPVGSIATFTYAVRNFGTMPLRDIAVNDDNGTPENLSDDFQPAPMLSGGFNVGDVNQDNWLDLTEVWRYTGSRMVSPGAYSNLGRASGQTSDGRTLRDSDPSNHFGVLDYPAIDMQKFVRGGSAPSQGGDLCDDHGKPAALTFAYTGGGPTATNTHQPPGKYSVIGDPNFASSVFIRVTDRASATDLSGRTYFFGQINLDEELMISAAEAGQSRFSANTYLHIFQNSNGSRLLQTVGYHTSCSAPIVLGDVVGGVTLTGFVGEDAKLIALPPSSAVGDLGVDADLPNGPSIFVGQQVVWTYRVVNWGNESATIVEVIDDHGSPGTSSDDFRPDPILAGGFNVGDVNKDGLLDPGESWYYRAVDQVITDGLYRNTGKVTATTVTTATSLTRSDPAHYLGVLPTIDVCKTGQKPQVLVMRYTADNVINSSQARGKVTASGNLGGATLVRIKATNKSNPNDKSARVYFDGLVSKSQNFGIDADRAGQRRLDPVTYVHIFHTVTGKLLRTIRFETSCSQPLVLGTRYGGVQLVGFIGERGATRGIQLPAATAADLSIKTQFWKNTVTMNVLNKSADRVATLQSLLVEWASGNKKLKSIKINGQTVFDKLTSPVSVLISDFKSDLSLRRFGPGASIRLTFEFESKVSMLPGGFGLSADLGNGMTQLWP